MNTLLLTSALLIPQAPADHLPQAARALETYPLIGLMGPFQEGAMPWPPPLSTFLRHNNVEPYQALRAGRGVETDTLIELLSGMHREAHEDGLLQLEVEGETLLVSGDSQLTAAVGRDLKQLRALLARPIAVEASLYHWPRDTAMSPVLRPDRLRESVQDLDRIWHGVAHIRSGQVAELGVESWSDYLRSVDAEVAQEASIGEPMMESAFEGVRLLVQPHALAGSEDLVLFCQAAFGRRREPIRRRATGVAELPSLDVPLIDMNAGAFSGRIHSGGALALTSTGHASAGSRAVLVVTARYDTPPSQLDDAGMGMFPVSALTVTSLQMVHTLPHEYPPLLENDTWFDGNDVERSYGSIDLDVLMELIGSLRPEEMEAEGSEVLECGSYVVVRGSPELIAAAENLLTGLQDRWLANDALEFHTATRGEGEGTWHRLAVPALQGRRHVFLRGTETTAMRDFQASIAQDATLYSPRVESVFSGVATVFETSPGDNGTLVDLRLQLAHVPAAQRRPLEARPGGDLYPAEYRIARFQHRGELIPGRAIHLGDGPRVEATEGPLQSTQRVTLFAR